MIPMLLWRCPLCATDEALEQRRRPLRADLLRCAACGAQWRVRRVPGDDFYLKLLHSAEDAGTERSLADWYAAMKQTVSLSPIYDDALPLEPGEALYLASRAAELEGEEDDPLLCPLPANPGGCPAQEAARRDKREVAGVVVGWGRLFLTNRRLAWRPTRPAGQGGDVLSFSLQRLNSAYAMMDFGLALLVGTCLYAVYLPEESVLKWVHYLALVARQVEAETGHVISTSHY